tara:strand:- start:24 stop:155 length:132 start_codon:yes stop_codon:yes gene_type:complete
MLLQKNPVRPYRASENNDAMGLHVYNNVNDWTTGYINKGLSTD